MRLGGLLLIDEIQHRLEGQFSACGIILHGLGGYDFFPIGVNINTDPDPLYSHLVYLNLPERIVYDVYLRF